MEDKPVFYFANKKRIPVILLQHGLEVFNSKLEKYTPFKTVLPSQGAIEAVWGNIMKNYLLDHKIKPEEILEVGSPKHDVFFRRKSRTRNSNTILLTVSPLMYIKFNGADTRSYEYLEECTKKIIYYIKKISDKKIIIKLHPAKSYYDIKPLIQQIDPTIPIYKHQNIIDLIETCDVMITLNYTTALLEAMILNKPTMLIETEKQNIGEEIMFKRGASLFVSDFNEIESKLNDLILNENIRKDLIQNGQEFINDYFVNHGTASEYLAKILENY
jgi:CDP-glycerol glycerophosphotransferase (TagB/SpsB family)